MQYFEAEAKKKAEEEPKVSDLGPLPKVHPRHIPFTEAALELMRWLNNWRGKHGLTRSEYLAILSEALHEEAVSCVRQERGIE